MPYERSCPPLARRPGLRRCPGTLAGALACAALIGACGSSKSSSTSTGASTKLDTARVARSIEQSILAQRHLKAIVSCPTGVLQEAGHTFECTARIKKGKKVTSTPFVVTIHNSRGYVTYVGK